MNLNEYKYAHIGNTEIKKDMFIDILNGTNKPYGGFWASPFNNIEGSISDRTDYILENADKKFQRFENNGGCLFNINSDSKVLNVLNDNDVENLKKRYSTGKIIDYEKLSKHYDAMYINPYSLSGYIRTTEFYTWETRSLLVFDIDIIKEYSPIEFEFQKNCGFFITKIGEEKTIEDLSLDYYDNQNIIKKLFEEKLESYPSTLHKLGILEDIKFLLMNEFRKSLDSSSYNIIEAIIINECTYQKKMIRRNSA